MPQRYYFPRIIPAFLSIGPDSVDPPNDMLHTRPEAKSCRMLGEIPSVVFVCTDLAPPCERRGNHTKTPNMPGGYLAGKDSY